MALIAAWSFAAVGGVVIVILSLIALPYTLSLGGAEAGHPAASVAANGAFVQIAGESLYYTHHPGGGDAVMPVHGFGGPTVTWTDTAQALAAAGFDVYAVGCTKRRRSLTRRCCHSCRVLELRGK